MFRDVATGAYWTALTARIDDSQVTYRCCSSGVSFVAIK